MPVIDRKVRTQIPGRGPSGRGLNRVAADTSLEQALGGLGETLQVNAEKHQKEEDNNFTYNSITQYNEELMPALQEEKERTGANTAGNIERVAEKSQVLKNSILEKASPRIQDSLRSKLERIDLANTTELSRLRATGIKVERQNKRDRILDTEKRIVLDSPFKALLSIETIAEMYDDEVDNGIITDDEADKLTKEAANEISVAAITSIGEKSGPTAQLGFLTSGMFDEVITVDQKEKFITEAQRLEKAIDAQAKIDAKQAELDSKRANAEAKDKLDGKWTLDIAEGESSIPEVQASEFHTEKEKADWEVKMNNSAEGKTVKTNVDTYDGLSTKFDKVTEDSSEDEINKIWASAREAYSQEKITRVDYDHFGKRRDNSLKKVDPLNGPDFKASENNINNFAKDGGFIPLDEKGNVVLKKNASPEQKLAGRERHNEFMKKFKKWQQDNPKENPQKWIDEQFVPVQTEVNKGITKSIINFMFGDLEEITRQSLEGSK